MPCCASLCFAFILRLARLPFQDRPENVRNSCGLCNDLTPVAIPHKLVEKTSVFTQNRKFLEKMLFSDPFVGGTTAGPKKVKKYNKNITENHREKSRDDFWSSGPRNLKEIAHVQWFLVKMLEKNAGTQDLGPPRLYKNNGTHELGPPKHYKNNGTHELGLIFLEPESCVPFFSRTKIVRTSIFIEKNSGTQVSANLSFGHPFHRQFLERKSLLDRENKWFWDH